jgi:hypothetical protein
MLSPTGALVWEIWRRGRRFGYLALGCVSFCVLLKLLGPERFCARPSIQGIFFFLMVWSFVFVFGFFNCTEINSSREWNGFPYRLFTIPVRTWKLAALPILMGVVGVELIYLAWTNLVWNQDNFPSREWFAVALGSYMVFYQTALWSLAGFRIIRLLVLGVGGSSSILVACFPLFRNELPAWLSETRASLFMAALALVSLFIAWRTVAHQRHGGGRRQNRLKALLDRVADVLPRRTRDFASPAAAQFWFEWRRAGWLLPMCVVLALLFIVTPIVWINRSDAVYLDYVLGWLLVMPVIFAFAIGKGYAKAEFWTTDLSLPSFFGTRPLASGEFVICKMRVAAWSVGLAWLLVLGFIAIWDSLTAKTSPVHTLMFFFRDLYPHSWLVIVFLAVAGLMILTWRCMVSGLWTGLSGRALFYGGSFGLQFITVVLLLIIWGISSDALDREIQHHPEVVKSTALAVIGWVVAVLVIIKLCLAAIAWSKITPQLSRQYLLVWSGTTLGFVTLGILLTPRADTYRLEHLFVLAAFLLAPLTRLGLAPWALAKNRHR